MTILIENLAFDTIIGILDHERFTPQKVQIDCTIEYLYTSESFINYAQIVSLIEATMHSEKFELIETALETLATRLKENFSAIQSINLTIRKPDILPQCTVGVQNYFIF